MCQCMTVGHVVAGAEGPKPAGRRASSGAGDASGVRRHCATARAAVAATPRAAATAATTVVYYDSWSSATAVHGPRRRSC